MKKLNLEELLIGGLFGLLMVVFIGLWALVLSPICALFWALSGAGYSKLFRRLGCPLLACLAIYLVHHQLLIWISLPLSFGVLSIGYGIPSTQPPDTGSSLGRFWVDCFTPKGNKIPNDPPTQAEILASAAFFTRATIYVLLIFCFIPGFIK